MSHKKTLEKFIIDANEKHNNKYDYSKVIYINNKIPVIIICPEHGQFIQRPDSHLRKIGCPVCGQIKCAKNQLKSLETFIVESNIKHGFKYNYDSTIYNGSHKKVLIRCLKHGYFSQTPNAHLKGCGCPICTESHGEREIRVFLQNNDINFIYQKTFKGCKYKNLLKFDFYLPKYNICIEYDGKQHFSSFYKFGGEEILKIQKIKDSIKTKYCNDNNIFLFRINYDNIINIKLKDLLQKIKNIK
ncbi:hypothetical protein M0Q97_01430 [Candidatus Dojkabacteria bacterium]|jgi:hypothetical protein|nr:hypothetical protein [Candidatus Dojkabacteria bacterium]